MSLLPYRAACAASFSRLFLPLPFLPLIGRRLFFCYGIRVTGLFCFLPSRYAHAQPQSFQQQYAIFSLLFCRSNCRRRAYLRTLSIYSRFASCRERCQRSNAIQY